MDYQNYNNEYNDGTEEQSKFRLIFLISAIGVLIVAILIAVGFLLNVKMKTDKYNSAIEAGNYYYTSGDYQNAIVQYQLAIAIDKKNSAGYLNMASAYIQLGDYNSAMAILDRGLSFAQNSIAQEKFATLKTLADTKFGQGSASATLTPGEIEEVSKQAIVENAYLDMIASYTFTDYFRDYGSVTPTIPAYGQLSLVYDSILLETIYYDLDNEKVLDNAGAMPVAVAKPCVVKARDLDRLFSTGTEKFAISFAKLNELLGDNAKLDFDSANNRYVVTADYKHCRISIETDESGNLVSRFAWNEIVPLQRGDVTDNDEVDGSVSGYVQDAMTGRGMKATLKVRNRGVRSGEAIATVESGTDGSYTFEGLAGMYTAEVTAQGYVTEYLDLDIIKNQTKTGVNIVLSPTVGQGEMRIVLSWGSSPSDLDSHVTGRSSNNQAFHIYYADRNFNGVGNLDVDDTNGYGPETITITDIGSSFTYSVIDFTGSGTMSSSGAIVKVYFQDGSVQTFNIPAGSGNTWNVFSYNNGQITMINSIS